MSELVATLDRASAVYKKARPEIGTVQDEGIDEIDKGVFEAATWAYELKAVLHGFTQRLERGEKPTADWYRTFEGAYRFYTEENFALVEERMNKAWPCIAEYTAIVRESEKIFEKELNSFHSDK